MDQAEREEVLPQLLSVRPARVGEPVRLRVGLSVAEPSGGGLWSFGDGTTAVAAIRSGPGGPRSHAVHTYRRAGVYVITLVLDGSTAAVVEGLIAVASANRGGFAASGLATAVSADGHIAFAFTASETKHERGAAGALRLRCGSREYRCPRLGWWLATSHGWLHLGGLARSRSSPAAAWGRPRDVRISLRLVGAPRRRPRLSIHVYPPGSRAGRSIPDLSFECSVRHRDVIGFEAASRH